MKAQQIAQGPVAGSFRAALEPLETNSEAEEDIDNFEAVSAIVNA